MKTKYQIAAASAFALAFAALPALAQTGPTGIDALNDRIDDVSTDVNTDLARSNDAARFGNAELRQGLSGSASLGYNGKTGNNESQDFSVGARLRFGQGQFVHNLGLAIDYSEADGVKSKEDVFAVYDGNYYFNDQFYGFVLGRVETDGLAVTADDVATDAFIGFGPGYRVINTDQMAWRVQAGIGMSYLEDGLGDSTRETGYIASSRFFYQFNDNVFATMDTDVLKSDAALRVNNDLGVNMKLTDAFATRVSYMTEYNDSRAIQSDNKLGVSLVYGF